MGDSIVPAAPGISRRAALKALGAGAAVWPWLSDGGLLAFTDAQRRNAPDA